VLRKIGVLPAVVCARLKSALENAASKARNKVNVNVENEDDFTDSRFLKPSVSRLRTTGSADISSKQSVLLVKHDRQNRVIEFVFDV
jgi:hypothetical protein